MGSWWVTRIYHGGEDGPALLGSWIFWVIFSIVLHELAHGWAALSRGDRTPVETGHMTWNPLVHMGGMSLLLFALVGIAWGAMPVNPSRQRGRYAGAFVAAAGPAMNLVLALICAALSAALIVLDPEPTAGIKNLGIFLLVGTSLNLALMVFNLLPVPPLDGARILGNFVPAFDRFMSTEAGAITSLIGFIVLFAFMGGLIFSGAMIAGVSLITLFAAFYQLVGGFF